MIKVIIFDWGGVLTIGKHTTSIVRIIEERFSLENTFSFIDNLIISLDAGKMSFKRFCEEINKEFGINISIEEMRNIFDEAVIPNKELIELINKLKNNYKLIFLSNINKPTINILRTKHQDMLKLFDKLYFSFELKIRKPNKELFEYIIKDSKLNPEEGLFIDDKEKNIKGAKEIGMKTILFKENKQLVKDLQKLGVEI